MGLTLTSVHITLHRLCGFLFIHICTMLYKSQRYNLSKLYLMSRVWDISYYSGGRFPIIHSRTAHLNSLVDCESSPGRSSLLQCFL